MVDGSGWNQTCHALAGKHDALKAIRLEKTVGWLVNWQTALDTTSIELTLSQDDKYALQQNPLWTREIELAAEYAKRLKLELPPKRTDAGEVTDEKVETYNDTLRERYRECAKSCKQRQWLQRAV